VLQTIVTDDHINTRRNGRPRSGDPVVTDEYPRLRAFGDQHRLVAHGARIAACRNRTHVAVNAAVATRNDADRITLALQVRGDVDDEWRLARATDSQVANHDDRPPDRL